MILRLVEMMRVLLMIIIRYNFKDLMVGGLGLRNIFNFRLIMKPLNKYQNVSMCVCVF